MLDVLCFRDETGVEHLLGCVLLEQFLRFFDQPLHPFALLSRRAFAEHLEDLLEPLDVPFRFLKMMNAVVDEKTAEDRSAENEERTHTGLQAAQLHAPFLLANP